MGWPDLTQLIRIQQTSRTKFRKKEDQYIYVYYNVYEEEVYLWLEIKRFIKKFITEASDSRTH
jgi:hypothetical protein